MGTTTVGALIGAAIDGMGGDDSNVDGAIVGAVTANVLKIAVPVVLTYVVGWAVLRGIGQAYDAVAGGEETA